MPSIITSGKNKASRNSFGRNTDPIRTDVTALVIASFFHYITNCDVMPNKKANILRSFRTCLSLCCFLLFIYFTIVCLMNQHGLSNNLLQMNHCFVFKLSYQGMFSFHAIKLHSLHDTLDNYQNK